MIINNEFSKQIEGTKSVFFGLLQGIDSSVNINVPKYIYHYTSEQCFNSIVESETIRLYTIENFIDKNERKLKFNVENRVSGTFTDNNTGEKFDITTFINSELSNEFIFIQSNTYSSENDYLWKEYGDNKKGICLKLSTDKYINYVNSKIVNYDLLPDYYKCNYISYDLEEFDRFLNRILNSLEKLPNEFKKNLYPAWFFLLEYWRSFFKTISYKQEEEIRFVISDSYALFLFIVHLLIKWGVSKSDYPKEISDLFLQEYMQRKKLIHNTFNLMKENEKKFITIPLYEVLDSVIIGSKSELSKKLISNLSKMKIKKVNIKKSLKL